MLRMVAKHTSLILRIKVKPETGKTLIWPAEWTHIHAGEVVKSGNKYMITGHMFLPIPDVN